MMLLFRNLGTNDQDMIVSTVRNVAIILGVFEATMSLKGTKTDSTRR